jgi:hypothetical protein
MATGTQLTVNNYIDLNYYGINTDNGLIIVKSFAAIKQVIKLYLLSKPGDYGRNILKGGPLFALIGKRMLSSKDIETAVTNAMSIFTNITVANILAKKDLTNRMWIVSMQIIDTANKAIDNLSIGIPAS